jgi:hypothetical protein
MVFHFGLFYYNEIKYGDKPFLAFGWLYGWLTRQKKYDFSQLHRLAVLHRVKRKLLKMRFSLKFPIQIVNFK